MKRLLFTYLVCLFYTNAFCQFSLEGETQTYYYGDIPNEIHEIDTDLQNFEEYNYESTDGWEYFNTSIFGSAQQKISFDWNRRKGFQDGNVFFDNYKYHIDKIRYFNTQKYPYSELSYLLGTRLEQKAEIVHAQNIKNKFQFALEARGISSSGIYDNDQRVRDFGLSFYGKYSSKNDRYHLGVDFTYSSIKANETGGVQEDILNVPPVNKLFYNTNIDEATTKQSTLSLNVKNAYNFGFSRIDSINDTLSVRHFYPVFSLKHSIGTNIVKNSFSDYAADSTFYGDFFQENSPTNDSLVYNLRYHNIPHRIAFQYLGTNKTDSVTYTNVKAELALQHNNIEVWQNGLERTYNNLMAEFTIESNDKIESNFGYRFNSTLFLAGFNVFDASFRTDGHYSFGKAGILSATILYETVTPTWIETFYHSTSLKWEKFYSQKKNTEFVLNYHLPKHHLKVNFNANLLENYVYFNKESIPIQTDAKIVYWNVSVRKDTKWKIWHWNNFIGFQYTNHQEILPLPSLFLKTSLYADFKTFKGNMILNIGFDLRYNTAFRSRAWNPVISQFYVQEEQTMQYTPVVDVFLSTKIKSLRVYAKLNYANEGLFQANNYKALNYPSNGRSFSIGLSWRFFE